LSHIIVTQLFALIWTTGRYFCLTIYLHFQPNLGNIIFFIFENVFFDLLLKNVTRPTHRIRFTVEYGCFHWVRVKFNKYFQLVIAATDFHVSPMDWSKTGEEVFVTASDVIDADDCPAKSSVMALAVTCALLVINIRDCSFYQKSVNCTEPSPSVRVPASFNYKTIPILLSLSQQRFKTIFCLHNNSKIASKRVPLKFKQSSLKRKNNVILKYFLIALTFLRYLKIILCSLKHNFLL